MHLSRLPERGKGRGENCAAAAGAVKCARRRSSAACSRSLIAFLSRLLLVLLFFPFSALDKVLNFPLAVEQAQQQARGWALPRLLILAGLAVEVFMSLGVLTGVADRLCAAVLGLYCVVTARAVEEVLGEAGFPADRGQRGARGVLGLPEEPRRRRRLFHAGLRVERIRRSRLHAGAVRLAPPLSRRRHDLRTPVVRYWRLYTDAEGVSRWRRCAMTHFALKSMQPPAAPQWQGEPTRGDLSVMVTVQPVGWVGDWHENPKPQWIAPLSGRWFVEAMDGERREFGPGELSFGGDQNTRAKDGRKGHRLRHGRRCAGGADGRAIQRPRRRSRLHAGRLSRAGATARRLRRGRGASPELRPAHARQRAAGKARRGVSLARGAGLDGRLGRAAVPGPAERPHDDLARQRRRRRVARALAFRQRPGARPPGPAHDLLASPSRGAAHRIRRFPDDRWSTATAASGSTRPTMSSSPPTARSGSPIRSTAFPTTTRAACRQASSRRRSTATTPPATR